MNGLLFLTWSHLRCNSGRTAILVGCTALTMFLPVAGALLVSGYERDLSARAIATPMLLGAKGNRFDLVLAALYFKSSKIERVTQAAADELLAEGNGTVIPLHLGFTAQQRPVVGTTPEYFELRRLRPAQGSWPQLIGDACVGADAARDLHLASGDSLLSDPRELYALAAPASVKLRVCGVLSRTGTADDGAVFVDVKTGWMLEGLVHGHQARGVNPELVLAQGSHVVLSEALIEHQEITETNVADFHFHGAAANLPLTAVLFVPDSAKVATMTKAKMNTAGKLQMLVPGDVVRDLVTLVFQVKRLFDALTLVLGLITAGLVGLVLLLSAHLRRGEMQTLHRLGCSPRTVAWLHASELAFILGLGAALAGVLVLLTLWLLPNAAALLQVV